MLSPITDLPGCKICFGTFGRPQISILRIFHSRGAAQSSCAPAVLRLQWRRDAVPSSVLSSMTWKAISNPNHSLICSAEQENVACPKQDVARLVSHCNLYFYYGGCLCTGCSGKLWLHHRASNQKDLYSHSGLTVTETSHTRVQGRKQRKGSEQTPAKPDCKEPVCNRVKSGHGAVTGDKTSSRPKEIIIQPTNTTSIISISRDRTRLVLGIEYNTCIIFCAISILLLKNIQK